MMNNYQGRRNVPRARAKGYCGTKELRIKHKLSYFSEVKRCHNNVCTCRSRAPKDCTHSRANRKRQKQGKTVLRQYIYQYLINQLKTLLTLLVLDMYVTYRTCNSLGLRKLTGHACNSLELSIKLEMQFNPDYSSYYTILY